MEFYFMLKTIRSLLLPTVFLYRYLRCLIKKNVYAHVCIHIC